MIPNPMLLQMMQKAQMGGKPMMQKAPGPAAPMTADPRMMQKGAMPPNKLQPGFADRMQAVAPMMAQLAGMQPQGMAPMQGGQPLPMQMMALNPLYDFQRFQFNTPGMQGLLS